MDHTYYKTAYIFLNVLTPQQKKEIVDQMDRGENIDQNLPMWGSDDDGHPVLYTDAVSNREPRYVFSGWMRSALTEVFQDDWRTLDYNMQITQAVGDYGDEELGTFYYGPNGEKRRRAALLETVRLYTQTIAALLPEVLTNKTHQGLMLGDLSLFMRQTDRYFKLQEND